LKIITDVKKIVLSLGLYESRVTVLVQISSEASLFPLFSTRMGSQLCARIHYCYTQPSKKEGLKCPDFEWLA
jgi:hypothetical protein